jgi:hypothetical protein
MAVANAAATTKKEVNDPIAEYTSMQGMWDRCRAICSGERFAKDFDGTVDVTNYSNFLIPFSPTMTNAQYNFFKAEAELPGIVAQFSKMLIGGLLRKKPQLTLPDNITEEANEWIISAFGQNDSSLLSFLDRALWEEIQTSRAWIYVDYPRIKNPETMTKEEFLELAPYPVLWRADEIINWKVGTNDLGVTMLTMVVTRSLEASATESDEFHDVFVDTVRVHDIDDGFYRVRVFQNEVPETSVPTVAGQKVEPKGSGGTFKLVETIDDIRSHDERLRVIPAWPLNGSIEVTEPILMPLVDKEVNLYNKVSRRNHLLYGAATYTPVVMSDMTAEAFDAIVDSGLGTWIHLDKGDDIKALETPTDALKDMESSIANGMEEMARLGVRMLSPETAQSGVALEIRNAAQTAQLGTLNSKISTTMMKVICFMINWRYDAGLKYTEIDFTLSPDFNPIPLGADWLRLATEWYEGGLIPRSVWLQILKHNDIVSPDYDDAEGLEEINGSDHLNPSSSDSSVDSEEE